MLLRLWQVQRHSTLQEPETIVNVDIEACVKFVVEVGIDEGRDLMANGCGELSILWTLAWRPELCMVSEYPA